MSSAKKEGQELICVTLNATDDWNDHIKLLDYGFDNFKAETIAQKGEFALSFTYDKNNNKSVDLLYSDNYVISKTNDDKITTKTEVKNVKLPIKKGDVIGNLRIYCNGKEIGEIPLLAAKNIRRETFFEKIKNYIISIFGK